MIHFNKITTGIDLIGCAKCTIGGFVNESKWPINALLTVNVIRPVNDYIVT